MSDSIDECVEYTGDWTECWNCNGDGVSHHDCGEDTCCCLEPEDNVRCDVCHGLGGWSPDEAGAQDDESPAREELSSLLPCPFCGSANLRTGYSMFLDDAGEYPGVECLDCDASNRLAHWNKREAKKPLGADAARELLVATLGQSAAGLASEKIAAAAERLDVLSSSMLGTDMVSNDYRRAAKQDVKSLYDIAGRLSEIDL